VVKVKVKGKGHPRTVHEGLEGEQMCSYSLLFELGFIWVVGGQEHAPAALPLPGEKTRYPLYRRLCGSRGRCGRVQKISPPPTGIRSPDRPARRLVDIPTDLSLPASCLVVHTVTTGLKWV
jgi:hypothetical protein